MLKLKFNLLHLIKMASTIKHQKTFGFYLLDKFSKMFLNDVINTMQPKQAKIINDFISSVKLGNFVLDNNLKQLDLLVEIYNNHIEELDDYFLMQIEQDDLDELKRVEKFYLEIFDRLELDEKYNDDLRKESNQILQANQIFEIAGNLHYSMTLDEMKAKLASNLKNVRIFNSYEFDKLDSRDQWFQCNSSDVSRILGANYLKKKFNEIGETTFDVPEFIIVIENYNIGKPLKIKIHFGGSFPIATSIFDVKIYSRKIIGRPVANQYQGNHTLYNCGYVDLGGDNGNIIQDDSGISFIVDTEFNSFDMKIMTDQKDFLLFTKYYFWTINSLNDYKYCEVDVIV